MEKNRFTIDELMEDLRMKGINDLSKVIICHSGDQRTAFRPSLRQPAAADRRADELLRRPRAGLPLVIISDGHQLSHNLQARGLSELWRMIA
jgi:uncharacterized membrane protein YcaP (DUF421 family)